MRTSRLPYRSIDHPKLSHYLFRYPAKFHPPVVRELLSRYTKRGDTILDPFCGSGTLLVEAAVLGRSAIGVDVDPVAAFVARVKTHRYRVSSLKADWSTLQRRLKRIRRSESEYKRRQFDDITETTLHRNLRDSDVWVPEIPNIQHWFRRYVIFDLARLLHAIETLEVGSTHRDFFRLCFASIIRNASNADPVPVSGLEVTKHMLKRDEQGRVVNPFALFEFAVERSLTGVADLVAERGPGARIRAYQCDVTRVTRVVKQEVSAVITSPPYHGAVEYYRRHMLEMYWLGFTRSHAERLDLLHQYIGRPKVPAQHAFVSDSSLDGLALVERWESRIRKASPERANAFKHYVVGMRAAMMELAAVLPPKAPAVFVVGRSRWNGREIPTSALFRELAQEWFSLKRRYWYPVKNRYMSYDRHNGADINRESVLVFRRRK